MYQPIEGSEPIPLTPELTTFFEWAHARGIRWNKIEYPVLFPPGYIGTRATDTIYPNEVIISAPNNALFTTETVKRSDLAHIISQCPDLFEETNSYYDYMLLITFILWEANKGDASEWAPFINVQPKCPETIQDWSPEELKELQDPDLEYDSEKHFAYHHYAYTLWRQNLSKFEEFPQDLLTFQNFKWAWRLIGTRTFGKFVPHVTFFPVGEFLNHDNTETYYCYVSPNETPDSSGRYNGYENYEDHDDRICEKDLLIHFTFHILVEANQNLTPLEDTDIYKEIQNEAWTLDRKNEIENRRKNDWKPLSDTLIEGEDKSMQMVAGPTEKYEKGSEIYMSYGRYSNRQLLCVYGFALKNNKYNYARIKVKFERFTKNPAIVEFLEKKEINEFIPFKLKHHELCLDLLRIIRALNWDSSISKESFFNPASLRYEISVLNHALDILQAELAEFSTTLEEDVSLFDQNSTAHFYFALVYRSERKKIIHSHINLINICKVILTRMIEGQPLNRALEIVGDFENEIGNINLEYPNNRKVLSSYISTFQFN